MQSKLLPKVTSYIHKPHTGAFLTFVLCSTAVAEDGDSSDSSGTGSNERAHLPVQLKKLSLYQRDQPGNRCTTTDGPQLQHHPLSPQLLLPLFLVRKRPSLLFLPINRLLLVMSC